jgi:hypothetical protein
MGTSRRGNVWVDVTINGGQVELVTITRSTLQYRTTSRTAGASRGQAVGAGQHRERRHLQLPGISDRGKPGAPGGTGMIASPPTLITRTVHEFATVAMDTLVHVNVVSTHRASRSRRSCSARSAGSTRSNGSGSRSNPIPRSCS